MVLEVEMSKTYQYRKVMKPMLERKRRARINKCLDELKDIMVECLTQEGEHITRLEKADILELTVEHMKKLRAQKQLRLGPGAGSPPGPGATAVPANTAQDPKLTIAESFRAGYVHAANEVSKTLAAVPGVTVDLGTQLMSHLGHRLNYLQVVVPGLPLTPTTAAAAAAAAGVTVLPAPSPPVVATMMMPSPQTVTGTAFGCLPGQYFANAATTHTTLERRTPSTIITPPPSECGSSASGRCSPVASDSASMWRPW